MSQDIQLSVIIPIWNREKHVVQSIYSVLASEDFSNVSAEIIVIDDGSTDRSVEVIKERFGDKIKLIELEHTGKPAIVRNAGLKAATGQFIAFQDSDDVWVNRNLTEELKAFDDPKVVFSYANASYIDANGNQIKNGLLVKPKEVMNGYSFMRKVSKRPAPVPTPTVIIRKTAVDKIGLFNENLIVGTDTDYWIRVLTTGEARFNNEVKALIRRDGSNISSMPSETGDKALYKHELSRIEMFRNIVAEINLTDREKVVMEYRIAELHFYVQEIADRLKIEAPFDIAKITLPPKPPELEEIDAVYEKSLAGRVDKVLKITLGWSPKLYNSVRSGLKTVNSALKGLK